MKRLVFICALCLAHHSFAQAPTKAETLTRPGSELPSENFGGPAADANLAKSKKAVQNEASVEIRPTSGQTAKGEIQFLQSKGRLSISGRIEGLKANSIHGIHIHENGDCSAADASSAGDHFNPVNEKHGALGRTPSAHMGDLGNISADANGVAVIDRKFDGLRLNTGKGSIVGRSVVVHEKIDDLKSQPAGDSGSRIACGIISPSSVSR
jgi:superoxide dismutase, Cu-Zn family